MRGRTVRETLTVALVCLCFTGSAWAHDPDWKPEAGDDSKASPASAEQQTTKVEREKWPDPFAEERKWGPIHLGLAGGYFVPWQGNGGYAVTGHGLVSSPTGRIRFGGEVLYRSYESRIFDVNDVDVDTYEINFVFHYLFNPSGISPYVGGVTGFQINKIRKTEVQGQGPPFRRVTDDVGVGWGLAVLAGLEIPISDHLALYGEARVGLAYQQTSDEDNRHGSGRSHDNDDTEDLGGVTNVLGVRYRF